MAQQKKRMFGRMPLKALVRICAVSLLSYGGVAKAQYAGYVSSLAVDARTGAVLSATDPDLQRYPASLTKMMTLYLTFQALQAGNITLDDAMPVSIHAAVQAPSKLGLHPGSSLTVEQGILALVTKSANDAACVLGEFLGGGDETRFAAMMTRMARSLGMNNTTFRNASGLPDPDQVTTARDMARLAQHLIRDYPQYYHYFSEPEFVFHHRVIPSHNPMLKLYAGADGLKTGYTGLAGHNLVSSAQQGGTRIIGVVLGARSNNSRNEAMIALLNDGFTQEGQTPLPLLKAMPVAIHHRPVAAHKKSTPHHAPTRHLQDGVVLVSYHPHTASQNAATKHKHAVVRHTKASRRGHHRS